MQTIVSVHLFATLSMVGLIWFVQIVHYPMMANVGADGFEEYEQIHQQRTTIVVAPLMLAELATTLLLFQYSPSPVPQWMVLTGLGLLVAIWASTYLLQVPMHGKLASGFDADSHRFLVSSNWLRTFAWTARGLVAIAIAQAAFSAPAV